MTSYLGDGGRKLASLAGLKGENSCTPYSKIMAAWELLHWSGVFLCMRLVILLHVVVSVVTYIVTVVTGGRFREKVEAGRRVVLLITAHPDDECMFFAPFLLQSCPTSHVHVLCLTTGNWNNKQCVCGGGGGGH